MRLWVLFLALLGGPGFSAQADAAACANKPNPERVIFFINTNGSYRELGGAEQAACERGETLVVFPQIHDPDYAKFGEVVSRYQNLNSTLEKNCSGEKIKGASCVQLQEKIAALLPAYEAGMSKARLKFFTPEDLKAQIRILAEKKISVSSLIVSGHDGGGSFSGVFGRFRKDQLIEAFNKASKVYPGIMQNLHSILLWGCYTATPQEVNDWKEAFPSARVLAGFYGSAPLSTREASRELMKDVLIRADAVSQTYDQKALKRALLQLSKIGETTASLYVRACGGKDWYFHNQEIKDSQGHESVISDLETFDQIQQCEGEVDKIRALSRPFEYGDQDIPEDTSKGPLRNLYSLVRQKEHCINDGSPINANHIGLLLFFNGVKKNFGVFASDLIQAADREILKILNSATDEQITAKYEDDYRRSYEYLIRTYRSDMERPESTEDDKTALRSRIEALQKILSNLKADPELIKARSGFINDLRSYWTPDLEHLQNKSRKEILAEVHLMSSLVSMAGFLQTPEFNPDPIRRLALTMQNYLVALRPDCMDFLEWHEYQPDRKVQGHCPL